MGSEQTVKAVSDHIPQFCSGTVVAEPVVVTSACFGTTAPSLVEVVLGERGFAGSLSWSLVVEVGHRSEIVTEMDYRNSKLLVAAPWSRHM